MRGVPERALNGTGDRSRELKPSRIECELIQPEKSRRHGGVIFEKPVDLSDAGRV